MLNRLKLKKNWETFLNDIKLSRYLVKEILLIANKSIEENGKFSIVLSGGRSFIDTYKILRESKSNWKKWHIYLTDERCVPLNDYRRNDKLINSLWLNNKKIPKKNIHFIFAELDKKKAVNQYKSLLQKVNKFDVVLLGMGEDGHVASLFPKHRYDDNESVVIESNSPKPPKERITLSYSRLTKSRYIFKIVCGSSKFNALNSWIKNKKLPINKIQVEGERVLISYNVFR